MPPDQHRAGRGRVAEVVRVDPDRASRLSVREMVGTAQDVAQPFGEVLRSPPALRIVGSLPSEKNGRSSAATT